MALLPRLPKINLGAQEVSYTLNTALDTTEGRGLWPATMVPGLAIDTVRTLNTTTGTLTSFAPWPTASVAYNQAQVTALVNHVTPTPIKANDDTYTYDNGQTGKSYTLDVLANDSEESNVINNVSPLIGPDVLITDIDDTFFTLGTLSVSEDGKSIDFDLDRVFDGLPFADDRTASFTYTVTNLSGFSSTATVVITVNQYVVHLESQANGTTFQLSDASETIHGTEYDDIIRAGGGNDTVYGNGGSDEIYGEAGDDLIFGGTQPSVIFGGDGNDTLHAGQNGGSIYGDAGDDKLYGSDNRDFLYGGDGNDTIDGGGYKDSIYGGNGDDIIDGGDGLDTINGEDGNDTIYGGNGVDNIFGGNGNDVIYGGDLLDRISGGAGDDVIHGEEGGDIVFGDEGNDIIDGGAGGDTIFGGDGDDELYAGSGDDTSNDISGDDGNDTIYGASGFDQLFGGADNDTISTGSGGGEAFGESGNDVLYGSDTRDWLLGGSGHDVIYSGGGSDTINGGAGFDVLFGAADEAADIFVFGNGSEVDVVFDFEQGFDTFYTQGLDTLHTLADYDALAGADGILNDGDSNGTLFVYLNAMEIEGHGLVNGLQIDRLDQDTLFIADITSLSASDFYSLA